MRVSRSRSTSGNPILPLSGWLANASTSKILVVGPAAFSLASLCGGWTLGSVATGNGKCGSPVPNGSGPPLVNATAALASVRGIIVAGQLGCDYSHCDPVALAEAVAAAAKADVIILALGEAPERETSGDIQSLLLDPAQAQLFAALNATGIPIITVLVAPRPHVLGAVADDSAAILMAYLPCIMGGVAIAETLFGLINPSGRLPFTYPRSDGDVDVYFHKPWNGTYEGVPDTTYHNPLFEFGTGLGYSALVYSAPTVTPASVPAGGSVTVEFNITNTGMMKAEETSLVFVRQQFRSGVSPEVRMLKGFTKTTIPGGTSAAVPVRVILDTGDWAYWTPVRIYECLEYLF